MRGRVEKGVRGCERCGFAFAEVGLKPCGSIGAERTLSAGQSPQPWPRLLAGSLGSSREEWLTPRAPAQGWSEVGIRYDASIAGEGAGITEDTEQNDSAFVPGDLGTRRVMVRGRFKNPTLGIPNRHGNLFLYKREKLFCHEGTEHTKKYDRPHRRDSAWCARCLRGKAIPSVLTTRPRIERRTRCMRYPPDFSFRQRLIFRCGRAPSRTAGWAWAIGASAIGASAIGASAIGASA